MKDFLSNVWVKRAVSVFNVAYFAVITLLTYATFLYDLEFAAGREKSFFTVYVVINVVFMGLMLFSRRELVTERAWGDQGASPEAGMQGGTGN